MTTKLSQVQNMQGRVRPKYIFSLAAITVFFGAVNSIAYVAAPSLFELDPARAPFTIAKNFELTRVYSRAVEAYEQVARDFPDSKYYDPARIGAANALLALGKSDEAIAAYEKILSTLVLDETLKDKKLIVLSMLAKAFQQTGNNEKFSTIFDQLSLEFPNSKETEDANQYSEIIKSMENQSGIIAAEQSSIITISSDEARVSQPFKVTVTIMPDAVPAGTFSIAINSSFVSQFEFVSVVPKSGGTQDYWEKRFFQFSANGRDPTEYVFTFKPKTPGKHILDLDIESNFSLIEMNKIHAIEVLGD